MKRSHIYAIVVIAISIAIIVSTAGDASNYVNFNKAKEMALNGNENNIHIVGELTKNSDGTIDGIEPASDKLSFSFDMIDDNEQVQRVFYANPMPADFKRSEKIVVVGSYQNDMFVADKILMKCPSKYQETEISVE